VTWCCDLTCFGNLGTQETFRDKKDFKNDFFGGALAGAFVGLQRKTLHSVVTTSVGLGLLAVTTAFV
jgi:hypothetical protein